MYGLKLTVLLTILTLTISTSVNSETATSGNLLPNAGAGQSSFQNTTDAYAPDKVGSGQGFTIDSGIQAFQNELEAKGEGIVSDTGSLVGISTTTQSGNSFTTTTDSLDGGVTLNAITEVQNCEWTSSSYRCGQASQGGGQRDTYTNTIKITDSNGNLLAITTFTRNNDAGYYGNTHTYTDTVTNTLPGSRNYEWEWKGTDGGNTNSTASIGPNLLGASLTATLLDINYSPISEETEEEIEFANEQLELSQETIEAAIEKLQEINLTELTEIETFEFAPQLIEIEEIQELKIEEIEFKALFEVNFKSILKEENLIEEFGTALIEENLTEEEFFEEATNMIIEELKPEESYNLNFNINHVFTLGSSSGTIDFDAFYTHFKNKILPDYETNENQIIYANLDGISISRGVAVNVQQNFQIPLSITAGGTFLDVYSIDENEVKELELLTPSFSGVFSMSYELAKYNASINLTGKVYGPMNLPTYDKPFNRAETSPWFTLQHLQLNKRFNSKLSAYFGVKNIFDYTQESPLIDPENPFGDNFDTAYAYGPMQGRRFVLGISYKL